MTDPVQTQTVKRQPAKPLYEKNPGSSVEPVKRPDPTRYGDWEKNGRCIDF